MNGISSAAVGIKARRPRGLKRKALVGGGNRCCAALLLDFQSQRTIRLEEIRLCILKQTKTDCAI